LKETCDRHDKRYYPDFKKWCDRYFFIEHRKESRGIGGIFFDDLDDKDENEVFSFIEDACNSFLPCYMPIIMKRKVLYFMYRTYFRICHIPNNKKTGNKFDVVDTLNSILSSIEVLNLAYELQELESNQF
jgi:Coproporphyrinogen III oxidase